MSQQKIDLYFMTMCVTSVWKESYPEEVFSIVLHYGDDEYEIHVFEHENDWIEVIIDVFGQNQEHENCTIYMSKTPSELFINACKYRCVEQIIFIPTEEFDRNNENIKLIPFVSSFGKIIDILSQYKPKVI
jgi:hypothetical protein